MGFLGGKGFCTSHTSETVQVEDVKQTGWRDEKLFKFGHLAFYGEDTISTCSLFFSKVAGFGVGIRTWWQYILRLIL